MFLLRNFKLRKKMMVVGSKLKVENTCELTIFERVSTWGAISNLEQNARADCIGDPLRDNWKGLEATATLRGRQYRAKTINYGESSSQQ